MSMEGTNEAAFTQTISKRARSRSTIPMDPSGKKMRLSLSAQRARSASRPPRDEMAIPDPEERIRLKAMATKSFKQKQVKGQRHESDRHIFDLKPKHLLSGKRGIGATSRR